MLSCLYEEFLVKGDSTCRPCPTCPRGQGVDKQCESALTIIFDTDNIPKCKSCIEGKTFSAYSSRSVCDPCSPIVQKHRVKSKCTRFHNRVTECKRGWYESRSLHDCDRQCCYCDKQAKHIQKCIDDNMEDGKFCAPSSDDGKCWTRIKTTTRPTTKARTVSSVSSRPRPVPTTSPVTTINANSSTKQASKSLTTTMSPTTKHATSKFTSRSTTNTTSPTEIPSNDHRFSTSVYMPIAVVLAIPVALLVAVVAYFIYKKCTKRRGVGPLSAEIGLYGSTHDVREDVEDAPQKSLPDYEQIPLSDSGVSSPKPSETPALPPRNPGTASSTRDSSRRNSQDPLLAARGETSRRNRESTPSTILYLESTPSTADSSRRNSQDCLIPAGGETSSRNRDCLLAAGGETSSRNRDCLLAAGGETSSRNQESTPSTADSSIRNSQDCLLAAGGETSSRNRGIQLSSFRHRHRKKLARILDLRGNNIEKNWLEYGKYLAFHDEILEEHVDRCHECYYGGGSATKAMFWQLSMKKPLLKVEQFRETADRLGRHDIAQYMTKHNIDNELLFFEIQDRHKTGIAYILEKRKEVEYWPDFADAFGFSAVDIAHFQEKKKTEQKYSPTSELIILLITHRPEITIDELKRAAIAIDRWDAYDCLKEIAQDLDAET